MSRNGCIPADHTFCSVAKAGCVFPGEAIAICMPMTASTVALYLGIIWAGCAVVGIADSFAQVGIVSMNGLHTRVP